MSKAEPLRVNLSAPLEGHYLLLDPDALTLGFLEDIEGRSTGRALDALVEAIVGGDLPHGTDRPGLRRLKGAETVAVLRAINEVFFVPKSGA